MYSEVAAAVQSVTTVTNVITIAHKLVAYPHITVVVLGDWLWHSEVSLSSESERQNLSRAKAGKL
jgi:DeoR/GlpR family transcriptional regulator of sugar metabolism